jgi:hypothetical protein
MIAAGVTKDYGVIACDSADFDVTTSAISFETPKLGLVSTGKAAMTYVGTPLYFSSIDKSKLTQPFDSVCIYLKTYLQSMRNHVGEALKEITDDIDHQQPNICVFFMGLHKNVPTLAQFNSFLDFSPRYLWSDNGLKFSTVLYGDDSKPEKNEIFKESTKFMENEAKFYDKVSPGIVAEILTRGIYKKADLEMTIGTKQKYAGGVVNVAKVDKEGVTPLSGYLVI